MAGLKVVPVKSLADGSLDLEDLKAKAEQHKDKLAAFMVCCELSGIQDVFTYCPRSHTLQLSVYSRLAFRM